MFPRPKLRERTIFSVGVKQFNKFNSDSAVSFKLRCK